MNIRTKILAAGAASVIFTIIAVLITIFYVSRSNRMQEIREQMSATLYQAESTRTNMDFFYTHNAFNTGALLEEARQQSGGRPLKETYAGSALYKTIPVVAAWNSVTEAAQRKGYEFHRPSKPGVPARNAANSDGDQYKEAFAAFERGEKEYFGHDATGTRLLLARPVVLAESCTACHGEPSQSLTHNGLDPVGFQMEGLKAGDLKGAFILEAPFTNDPIVASTMQRIAMIGGITMVIVMAGFFVLNKRMIIGPLERVIESVHQGSENTSQASGQIAAASDSLAQGASSQAEHLERTALALKQMSEMTQRNAETAEQASSISSQARQAAEDGNTAMDRMNRAINDIEKSASETAAIIKVIDEIAFQTNLLALNAAVEAARAGESGKGFAVVASEVRRLAQRSAEAARNTAQMIQNSVNDAKQGVTIADDVGKYLVSIKQGATKVSALVSEITSATREQADGITQVTESVAQMDKVTQANAAASEESASAAAELRTQAKDLEKTVDSLAMLVG